MTPGSAKQRRGRLDLVILLAGCVIFACLATTVFRAVHSNDFRHIYLGMKAILQGYEPYSPESLLNQASQASLGGEALNPYVYLPFTGLSLAFLYPLPFVAAQATWFVLNCLFLAIALALFLPQVFRSRGRLAIGLGLAVIFLAHPVIRTMTAGQLNMVLLFTLALSYRLLIRRREAAAGVVLGYAAMFKLAPGAFLLYLLLTRRWRALAAMSITMVVLMVISLAICGWEMHADFIPMLRQMSYGHSTWSPDEMAKHGFRGGAEFWKDPANQSPNSLLTHLLVSENGVTTPWFDASQDEANAATWAITLAFLALFAIALHRCRRDEPGAGFHATTILMLLVPSLMWDHYLVMLAMPTVWLANRYWVERRIWLLGITILFFVLICVPWPFAAREFREGWRVLLMTMKLYPTAGVFILVCCEAMRRKTVAFEGNSNDVLSTHKEPEDRTESA